jgi:hypothetical protein
VQTDVSLPHSEVLTTCPYPEQSVSPGPRLYVGTFRNKVCFFYGEELLARRPTPKLENHPLSAVRDCIFHIFAAILHIECRSSTRNLRTPHPIVTGTHLSRITVWKSTSWTKVTYFSTLEKSTHCFTSLNFVNFVKAVMILLKTFQHIQNNISIKMLISHFLNLLVSPCNLTFPLILIGVIFCLRYI